jgi:hypothetical protein
MGRVCVASVNINRTYKLHVMWQCKRAYMLPFQQNEQLQKESGKCSSTALALHGFAS